MEAAQNQRFGTSFGAGLGKAGRGKWMAGARTVLYLHHSNDLYGADVMLLETVRGLDRAVWRPLVALPEDSRGLGGLSAALAQMGVEQVWLPMAILRRKYLRGARAVRFAGEFGRAVWLVRRLLRERKVSLVHGNTLAVLAGACGAWLAGVPQVWQVHEIVRHPAWFRRVLHSACTRLPRVTVCVSEAVKTNVLADEPWAGGKVRVIHNGLSLGRFLTGTGRDAMRAGLGVAPDTLVVGMVGRINAWKGQEVLVECAARLRERFPGAEYWILGDVFGEDREPLERLRATVARFGVGDRVRLLSFRTDVAEVLAAMDVYAHLSTEPEPFGLAIVEAMAAGLAVVATGPGGPGEIVEDGVTGVLVGPRDVDGTATAIAGLLDDQEGRERMGAAGRERAFRRFSVERYNREIEDVYSFVLPDGPTARGAVTS